ncbi:MAG: 2-phospho-L-lactate transferase [Chloroflexi bacterium]|nr:2-phospho-L-lactate transferase [Chloroflexota bacterium]MCY3587521.1 2-phospho-L-lactate transferase [Chloroflexota bacterium]MCY3685552.1 2-phospho-L-lactate transferase [Chloroflexota bacterium]MDE2708454.1 2-phospho-L-lactate transferase [Chloroflexota bacterium]
MTRVAVLAGGVGAARFLDGLIRVVPPSDVTAIVNVGDDMEWAGLHISPDLDTVTYTLADMVNPETGWGLRGESHRTLDRLSELGGPDWFMIGDLDLATHLYRTHRLSAGDPLSEITRDLTARLGLECVITPVTDDRLRTVVGTDQGELAFQDYFVRRRASDPVHALRFDGAETAKPAPIVEHALAEADVIVVAPSNPFLSIDPLLSVRGVRELVTSNRAKVVAVSPIIGGQAVKGPAADILQSLGHDVSALGVGRLYEDLAEVFVLDETDAALADVIAAETGMRVVVMPTLMTDVGAKMALARGTLEAALDVA